MTEIPFTPVVNLDILRGKCHCRCVHCPVGITPAPKREEQFGCGEISLNLFSLYCKEIQLYDTITRLHAVGEPTLHSGFSSLLETIRAHGLKERFWIFTDGLFDEAMIPEIVSSLGLVEISINSTSADDYAATKGIDSYLKVCENIFKMRQYIQSTNSAARILLTRVQSDPVKDNEFSCYWNSKGFECFTRSYHGYSGLLTSRTGQETIIAAPKCSGPWRRYSLDGTLEKDRITAVTCLNILFQHPAQITDFHKMGFFPDSSIRDIWNNSAFSDFREKLVKNEITNTACDQCTDWMLTWGPKAEDLIKEKQIE